MHRLPADFFEAAPVKCAAVLRDFDNETNERRINTYTKQGAAEHARWCAGFARRHIPADYVWPLDSFSDYKVLVAPHQKIVTPALAKKLTAYVRAGGTLILAAQAGTKDENCHMLEQTAPGPLAGIAGVEVEDWTTLAPMKPDPRVSIPVRPSISTLSWSASALRPPGRLRTGPEAIRFSAKRLPSPETASARET